MESKEAQTAIPDGGDETVNDAEMLGSLSHVEMDNGLTTSTSNGGVAGETANESVDADDDDDNPQCGWFGIRPSCLQVKRK